jgi:hypothetical protein
VVFSSHSRILCDYRELVDAEWKSGTVQLNKETKLEVARLAREFSAAARSGLALPGTLTRRFTRCSRPGCKCVGEPPALHGPYWSWTRKINNKTVTRYLSEEEIDDYQSFFDNAKRLRALLAEIEALSLTVIDDELCGKVVAGRI